MDISSPIYIDALWLSIAFICGLVAKRIGLPPLVGFLVAGFLINFSGFQEGNLNSAIEAMADIGVMILLFTIGLKLKLKSLFKPEIWVTASVHMMLTVLAVAGVIFLLTYTGLTMFMGLDFKSAMLIGFALSFSSTVFVVKTLESRGEFDSYHGKIAIGILIIQDIFAVLFIALSDKKLPSVWVFTLPIILYVLHYALSKMLDLLEHGEMVPVFGFFATFITGAFSFSLIGLKPDLGALIMGMLLVNHPRVNELYDRMLEYKDFFLIAFFINVGLIGLPDANTFLTTVILLPLILFKGVLFLLILSRFKMQGRTAYLGALSLGNFSEFGLIVGVVGMQMGLMSEQWLVSIALLMSFSFVVAAPLNTYSHKIYDRYKDWILKLNKEEACIDKVPMNFGAAKYLVVGMGSIGRPTYDTLLQTTGKQVLGLDYSHDKINALAEQKYNVKWADTTDSELWDNVNCANLEAIFLTMSDFVSNFNTLEEIKRVKNRKFKVFAIAHYPDQIERYLENGVDSVFDYKENLGKDFVMNVLEQPA